jgi:parvulin-like peptidyl-prolyl isomerase
MLKKSLISLVLSVALVAPLLANTDGTIAVVNNEPILASEFNKKLMPLLEQLNANVSVDEQNTPAYQEKLKTFRNDILNQQINEVLLKQEAKKQKIKVPRREIDEAVSNLKKRFPSEADFTAELKKEGMTIGELEKELEAQSSIVKLVEKEVKARTKAPTEDDVKAFYEKVTTKMKGGATGLSPEEDAQVSQVADFLKRASSEQLRIRQIVIAFNQNAGTSEEKKAALARVANVKKALAGGMAFSEAARQFSEDPVTRARGGDVGLIVKGDLPKDIETKIFSMKIGEWTKEPIQMPNGYFFVRVEGQNAAKQFDFEEIKNDLAEMLYQINSKKAFDEFVAGLRSKASIKINPTWWQ